MIAYHNDMANKVAILAQLDAHAKADELVKGRYWANGKGCAVGCTIHSSDHAEYETRFGIPQMIAQLEDRIFEGLPNRQSKEWPVRFMLAIRPGADLSRVGWQFLHWILTDEGVNPGITHPLICEAVKQCADVILPLTKGEKVNETVARSAARAVKESTPAALEPARAALESAWAAAAAARWSAADSVAESAARSAAWSADSVAESAARSAAWSAESAAAAAWRWSAESAESAYIQMSDKLVELLEAT